MKFNNDPEWLKKMADREDSCYLSTGLPNPLAAPSDEELRSLTFKVIQACANCGDTGQPIEQKMSNQTKCACLEGSRQRRKEDREAMFIKFREVRDNTLRWVLATVEKSQAEETCLR